MIKIERLDIDRFLSVRDVVVDFSGFSDPVLVQGNNGAGKSAIFSDALTWTLFGRTPRGYCTTIPLGEEYSEVTVEATVDEKDRIKVTRQQHEKENKLKMWVNDTEVEGRIKALSAEIKRLFYTPEMFLSLSVLNQGFSHRFTALNSTEMGTFLEIITDAQKFSGAEAETRSRLEKAKSRDQQLLMKKSYLEAHSSSLTVALNGVKQSLAEAEAQQAQIQESRQAELTGYQNRVTELHKILAQLEASRANIDSEVGILSQKRTTLQERVEKGRQMIGGSEAKLKGLRAKHVEITKVGTNPICPTCQQPIDQQKFSVLAGEMVLNMNEVSKTLTWYTELWNELKTELDQVHQQVVIKQNEGSTIANQIGVAVGELRGIEAAVENLKKMETPQGAYIKSVKAQIADIEAKVKANDDEVREAAKEIEDNCARIKYLEFWSKGFGIRGIRNLRLDGLLEAINDRLRHYYENIFSNALRVSLSPEKELKSGEIRNRFEPRIDTDRGQLSYRGLSGGEQRCVDIMFHMAIRDIAWSLRGFYTDLMVCDEIFDSLDMKATENVINLLKDIQRLGVKVVVISHEPHLKAYFNHTITVEKNGVTRLA